VPAEQHQFAADEAALPSGDVTGNAQKTKDSITGITYKKEMLNLVHFTTQQLSCSKHPLW
jgi:hypothetical protein